MPSTLQVIALSGPKRNRKQPIDIAHGPEPDWRGSGAHEHARQAVASMLAEMGMGEASAAGAEDGEDRGEQNRLNISPLQVARALTPEAFRARRLGGMLSVLYRNQPYYAVADCRPDLASWRL